MAELLVLAPLRIEAAALPRRGDWTVIRSGMGPARARIAAARGLASDARAVAVVGLCAAVSPDLRAGDVVCATELRQAEGPALAVLGAGELTNILRRSGLRAHEGPILSTDHIARRDERRDLANVLAVDMESAWLADAADGRPLAVVRVVVEETGRDLVDVRTLTAGVRALRNLRRAASALDAWANAAERDGSRAYLVADEATREEQVNA